MSLYPTISRKFFEIMDELFHGFTLDAAADNDNRQPVEKWYTPQQDGLVQPWKDCTVWCAPPWSGQEMRWLVKADEEYQRHRVQSLVLLPADNFYPTAFQYLGLRFDRKIPTFHHKTGKLFKNMDMVGYAFGLGEPGWKRVKLPKMSY